jgi:hypothetical protein
VTSDFSDIPQQLIFLGCTVCGKIMAISQRLQCVQAQGAPSSERHGDCKCNVIAFCTRRRRGDLQILQFFGFAKDKIKPLAVIMDKPGQSLPDSFCYSCSREKVL